MTDKSTIQQVIGCLMQHPQFLSEVDKYLLTPNDFSSRFEKYIFSAIYGLYQKGAKIIEPIDIANFLEVNDAAKKTFDKENGIEYLQDIIEFSNPDNFSYYYQKLKKINLLRDLKRQGFDTKDFYIEDLTDNKATEINKAFEELSSQDIVDAIKKKLIHLEHDYAKSEEVQTESVASGIDELIDEFNDAVPEIGPKVQGSIYNQIIDGAQAGALTIRSGSSGLGKTRQAVGDACILSYPMRFNWVSKQWELIGGHQKVLFIITEQQIKQIQRMILAYLTGINESKFKYKRFTNEEWKVIHQAQKIIKDYEDYFIIVKMPNPTIELVKVITRENCLLHNIKHVFYDYIFIGPALLNEFKGFSLRNDEVLLMFATALKDLAVELQVSMMTSTQVNASADDNRNIRNEASLAGGRSTINKADNGAIMARPTKEELETLAPIIAKYGEPNCVTDIFKVRSGEWSQVRIWSIVDLGTMFKEDLFITDSRLDPIEGFFSQDAYDIKDWDETEYLTIEKYIKELNEGS